MTAYLLHKEQPESAAVVYRAAYETFVTLLYILTRPNHEAQVEAALVHFAYSRLEIVKWFADHPSAAKAERILAVMPADVVARAKKNHGSGKQKPKGPFGLSLKQTAEAVGVEGHESSYAVLSWEGHARIAGDNVEEHAPDETGLRTARFVRQVDPMWKEALADQARRFLREVYAAVAVAWVGSVLPLPPDS